MKNGIEKRPNVSSGTEKSIVLGQNLCYIPESLDLVEEVVENWLICQSSDLELQPDHIARLKSESSSHGFIKRFLKPIYAPWYIYVPAIWPNWVQ